MAETQSANAPAPGKSKKLIIIGVLAAVLVVAVAAVVLVMSNQARGDLYGEEGTSTEKVAVVPTFLPLENMVVNLADPGGDRFAQIGITLELQDESTASLIKQYMPSIRNGVLMLVSQRTAEELLQREGKEQLAADILREVTRPLGIHNGAAAANEGADSQRRRGTPVRRVLFSSFIIQ